MIRHLRDLLSRWQSAKHYKLELDFILGKANPESTLDERVLWLVQLMQWIRHRSLFLPASETEDVRRPVTRLKFLLLVLERNPQWKSSAAKTLRSILLDVDKLELFTSSGLPEELGFWSEFFRRIYSKVMPERPLTEDMSHLFSALFPEPADHEWFANLHNDTTEKLIQLFKHEQEDHESYNGTTGEIEEAILILSSQVRSIGLSYDIRLRTDRLHVTDLPFFTFTHETEKMLQLLKTAELPAIEKQLEVFRQSLVNCFDAFNDVYRHLDQHGVSLKVVYFLESAQSKLKRIDDLMILLMPGQLRPEIITYFVSQLIEENQEKHGVWALFKQDTRLIARKIVDRSAKAGENYITQTRSEYSQMFQRALGGGAFVALTVLLKISISGLHLPNFIQGFFYGLLYAASFVAIQICHYTLATKQPAMTGPTLATKLQQVYKGEPLSVVVDEIVKLIRTQVVGILGNVGMVVPTLFLIDMFFYFTMNKHIIIGEEKAFSLIHSNSILSFTLIFAAFTGVLLWLSSLFAGYMDNWFHLNKMREVIIHNRRFNFVFGRPNCVKFAGFLERNIADLSGNTSLGFMLGIVPGVMEFLGVFLDVRHVTLASGSVALGAFHYGWESLKMSEFWLAVFGVAGIGLLNLGVSFTLAFLLALKSRGIRGGKKREIYKAVIERFWRRPQDFFYPPKSDSHPQ